MTLRVGAVEPRSQYVAGAAQTDFSVPFEWRNDSDLRVYVNELQQTLNVDYTLVGAEVEGGGTVTFTSAMAGGEIVVIAGMMPIERDTEEYASGGQLPGLVLEASLDDITMRMKQLARDIGRSLHITPYDTSDAGDFELPSASARANKFLAFDALGAPTLAVSIGATVLTSAIVAALLWPQQAYETTAGETADTTKPITLVISPFRYFGVGDGVANDTNAVQGALDVVSILGNRAVLDLCGRNWCVSTIRLDARDITIRNGRLTAHASLPAGGAIICSLAGGADTANNQALLDAIHGAGVVTVRTAVPNSMENVTIENVSLYGAAAAVKGFWSTRFTRSCALINVYCNGCDDTGILINGSWSFKLDNVFCEGDSVNGTGLKLGVTGAGTGSGAVVCNGFTVINGEFTAMLNGAQWDFGTAGSWITPKFEFNANDGFTSQSANCGTMTSPYFEGNTNDALELGGTNSTTGLDGDFCEEWTIENPIFNQNTGRNIRLQQVRNIKVRGVRVTGAITDWYFIATGTGQWMRGCHLEVPEFSAAYITNFATEADARFNRWYNQYSGHRTSMIQENGSRTIDARDYGRFLYKTAGGAGETWTVVANATEEVPIGAEVEGANHGGGDLTFAVTADTLIGSGTIATGTGFRFRKILATTWMRVQ